MFKRVLLTLSVSFGLISPCWAETSSREPRESGRSESNPTLTDAAVIAAIIALSRAAYSGPCGCPDNTDSIGRRCGARSAYSRAGGRFVYCFESDVTPDMVQQYRGGRRQFGR